MHRKIAGISVIIFVLIILAVIGIKITIEYNVPKYMTYHLWQYRNNGEISYRIPGIVIMDSGTLIAYCEERKGLDDWADINIVYKRSTDNGKTWSNSTVLADGMSSSVTANNPIMIADGNRLHCLYEINYGVKSINGGVFYTYSDDEGITWSEHVDISSSVFPSIRNVAATGPGHGIVTSEGRIIVPVWLVLKEAGMEEKSHKPGIVATIYSDDRGKTWNEGELIAASDEVIDLSEPTVAELSNGSILLNCRNQGQYRAVSISRNGFSDWSKPAYDKELPDPSCFGSLFKYDSDTIFFVNNDSRSGRDNVTLKISEDDCATWNYKKIIQNSGGYADITASENYVYVLSEKVSNNIISYDENVSYAFSIDIHIFNMKWLYDE